MTTRPILLAILVCIIGTAPGRAIESYDITVTKEPPVVDRRTYTKRNVPKLAKGEEGRTDTKFQMSVGFDIDVTDKRKIGDGYMVTVRPKEARVKLSLPIVIWTPEDAPEKFLEHEDGHRKIAERIYDDADELIRLHARATLGAYFQGGGTDEAAAVQAAYKQAASRLNEAYRQAIYDYSRCVNEEYDRLTNHGLDAIEEAAAIDKSFEHCKRFHENLGSARLDAERSQHLWQRGH